MTISAFAGEKYLIIPNSNNDLQAISKLCSIDDYRKEGLIVAYILPDKLDQVSRLCSVVIPLSDEPTASVKTTGDEMQLKLDWTAYPTFSLYQSMMKEYVVNYPNICKLDTIGYTVSGKPLLVMEISDSTGKHDGEPSIEYASSIHGNELVGFYLMIRLIDYLTTNYDSQDDIGLRVRNLVNNEHIWILPLFNPDGTYYNGGDTSITNARRFNAHGIDLNRNFPEQFTDPVNTTTGREPETAAMMNFGMSHNFTVGAMFHTGAVVVNYPWDARPDKSMESGISESSDSSVFRQMSLAYSLKNSDFANSQSFKDGITNGALWYPAYGTRQDYFYHFLNCLDVTIELSVNGTPSSDILPNYWYANRESLLSYMEQAFLGIHGTVKNESGEPLYAKIAIEEILNAPVFTDSLKGDFHRPVVAGTYNLIASAQDYVSDTLRNIQLMKDSTIHLNIVLKKPNSSVNGDNNIESTVNVYPNPCRDFVYIQTANLFGSLDMELIDVLGNVILKNQSDANASSGNQFRINTSGLCPGAYFLKIGQGDKIFFKKIIKSE
jgi:hypothetical protein